MDHLMSKSQARDVLEPYLPRVRKCIQAGWSKYEELLRLAPGHFVPTRPTSQANLVYDFIVEAAKKEFLRDGVPEPHVRVSDKAGFLMVTFHDQIVLRFKKFRGQGLRTSGIPTRQQRLFAQQLPMGFVPTEVTKVVAGYLLDSLRSGIDRMAVTCTVGPEQRWVIDLVPEAAPEPAAFPAAERTGNPPAARVRSLRKSQTAQANERKDGDATRG